MSEGHRKSRILYWLAGGVIVLAVPVIATALLMYRVWRPAPEASYPPPASPAEANLQDLDYLGKVAERDRSFTPEARAGFRRRLAELMPQAATFDRARLAVEVARLTALADNGHTNAVIYFGKGSFRSLPIRLGTFADGLFVVKAREDSVEFLGAELLAVDGRPIDQLLGQLRNFIGGADTLFANHAPRLLTSPELLHAAGLGDNPTQSRLRLRLPDGTEIERTLSASTSEPLSRKNYWPVRDLSPVPIVNNPGGNVVWPHVLHRRRVPIYLSRPDQAYWHETSEESRLLYLQINRIKNSWPEPLETYLDSVLGEIRVKGIKTVAVDLRFNRGGDYLLTADFTRRLAETVPADGRIFILTGTNTYSAGIVTLARLRYFAGERGLQIGGPVGDRGQFWGEGGRVVLPNSRISIRYATGYHDWEKGCGLTDITRCFLFNYVFGVAPGSLAPQVETRLTFADYLAGRDPAMEEVLKRMVRP
ncbi:MAG TPA: hypothetical protein VL101_18195 [Nordella sp.]|nr:hypothetical protein [Nordella sp.]